MGLLRDLFRALQILGEEGPAAVAKKVQRRLGTAPGTIQAKPHPEPRPSDEGPGIRKRVLIVDTYMPMPDRESGSLRLVNLFAVLQDLGMAVTFAAANLEAPEPYVSQLQRRGIRVLYRSQVPSIRHHLRAQGHRYDWVILSRADTASRFISSVRRYCPRAALIFDTVDLHFLRETRRAALTGSWLLRLSARGRRRQELGLIARADMTWVVSPAERALLRSLVPDARIQVVSNIHAISEGRPPFEARRDLLFIGAFAHPPNRDGILWFARAILPRIQRRIPALRLWVIGADPPPDVRALASPSLRVLGYVPDVTAYFQGCRISVAPLRYGAGVKGKINQSLAHGLPVVATSPAIEGMFLEPERSVLLADAPQDFADAVVRLYHDAQLWRRLSEGGLAVMERHFSFDAARRAIERIEQVR